VVPFVELQSQFRAIEAEVREAIDRVLNRSWYVLGEECARFEQEFAAWVGTDTPSGSGTGPFIWPFARWVGHGDEVTVANTRAHLLKIGARRGARASMPSRNAHP
jgi:dTDP-4-amino-4,6-dideoxygalactose transaminase